MIRACAKTDVGKLRRTNQDYIFSSPEPVGACPNLFMVADGMGGQKAGDYASKFVVETIIDYLENHEEGSPVALLKEGVALANERLWKASHEDESLAGTGTTLVAAVIEDDTMYVANVGDSRLYLLNHNSQQITRDHSYVEELVKLGRMVRGSEEYLSQKNIITRAVGAEQIVDVDFFEISLKDGDYILLCSDGLTNMVNDQAIRDIVSMEEKLSVKADLLISLANANGGKDNIAVILIKPRISEVSEC